MKTKTVHSLTAVIASSLAIPAAIVGINGLAESKFSHTKAESGHKTEKGELYLPSGDSRAIQKAIASLPVHGGKIFLGPATFQIIEPLVLDRDNVELIGSGKETLLRLADRAGCPLLVIGNIKTPAAHITRNVVLRNLVLDGNQKSQGAECWGGICDSGGMTFIRNNALTIRAAEDIRVENITACNARSGGVVLEKVCRRVTVSGLEAHGNYFDGLACYETEDSIFTRLNLHHNNSAGISLDLQFNSNFVSDAKILNNGSQGIFMRSSHNNTFKKVEIQGNGQHGIFVAQEDALTDTSCTGNGFTNLQVHNNKGHGLRINDQSCTNNYLANSHFGSNSPGDVSEVTEKILTQTNVTSN